MITEEYIRNRPVMFMGNYGALGLIPQLLLECIAVCKTDELFFTVTLLDENDFSIEIKSKYNLSLLMALFTKEGQEAAYLLPFVLPALATSFEKRLINERELFLRFSLDETILGRISVDYLNLTERCLNVAVLNRKARLLLVDRKTQPHSQNYFHFPQGIFYVFSRAKAVSAGDFIYELRFDSLVNDNHFQIALAFCDQWFPEPTVISYANDVQTLAHGSLVEGVRNGLIRACKKYADLHTLSGLSIVQKKLLNGMLLIASVRGKGYKYGGPFKETLESDEVEKRANEIIYTLSLEFFKNHPAEASRFFQRFRKNPLPFTNP